jgi:hypothetical protein
MSSSSVDCSDHLEGDIYCEYELQYSISIDLEGYVEKLAKLATMYQSSVPQVLVMDART